VVFGGEEASGRPVTIRLQSIVPGRGARESAQGRIALALTAVSLAVLLIATANVGTLMRLRAARRRTESAVRVALGARPVHLVRRALQESLLLAVAGAAGGLVLARWFDAIVRVTLLPHLAPDESLLDGPTLAAALGLSLVAGLAAGLMPLRNARRLNVIEHLRAGTASGTSGRLGGQHVLIALQVALTTVLLVDAGLFVRSLDRVRAQDLGFSTAQLLLVDLEFRGRLSGPERDMAHHEAVRRLSQLPGVRRATVVQGMPFSSHNIPPIHIPGYQLPPPDVSQLPILYAATPEYLQMMGVTLIRGRLIAERDGPGAPLVVLVNESMARTVWRDQDPIGRCVRAGHGGLPGGDPMVGASYLPCREVIGVVRDSRARSLRTGNGEERLMQYYVPFAQLPPMPFPDAAAVHAVLVETHEPPRAMIGPVRRLIQGSSARPVLARARPYQELIDPQLRTWRLGATLFSALGVLALAIAAVGLYATIAWLAGQRTREIGLRMALGGDRRDVVGLVVRDGLRLAVTGTVAGVVIAVLTAPLVRDLLFETSPRDPVILLGAVATLLLVAVVAAVVPSVRASRVSPMVALRIDG
jgi:predicted permease